MQQLFVPCSVPLRYTRLRRKQRIIALATSSWQPVVRGPASGYPPRHLVDGNWVQHHKTPKCPLFFFHTNSFAISTNRPSSSSPIDTEVNHAEGPHSSFTVALHRLRLPRPPTNIANSSGIDAGHPSTPRQLSRTIHSTDTGLRCQDVDIKFCHRLSSRGCWAPCYIATRTNTLRTYNSVA